MKSNKKFLVRVLASMLLMDVTAVAMADPTYTYRLRTSGLRQAPASTGASTGTGTSTGTDTGAAAGQTGGTASSGAAAAAAPPELSTSSFTVYRSGLALNRATGQYSGTAQFTNNTGQTLTGPFHLVLADLTPNVTVDNLTGVYNGAPYITFGVSTIAPGGQVTVTTIFGNPQKVGINYTTTVYRGTL